MNQIVPIILSGGSGTRLWPLSRSMRPKQFISLVDQESLFQKTLLRLKKLPNIEAPIIVCNEDHRFMVAEQMQELGMTHDTIILEPTARNTAPAIASAAIRLLNRGSEFSHTMLVLPADHLIEGEEAFLETVQRGCEASEKGSLVTFGVLPTKPATGYGYIRINPNEKASVFPVEEFVEKPSEEKAITYLESGNYFWNSGMFVFTAEDYIDALKQHSPNVLTHSQTAMEQAVLDLDFLRLSSEHYSQCENISIDYAVMEKSTNVCMVPLNSHWSDIGSWSSLWETGEKDGAGNVVKGDVVLESVTNSYIHAESKLVTALGVDNLIVVETHDGLMVTTQGQDQNIKKIVNRLKETNRPETELHRKAFRPWGNYDCLDKGGRFQVKRIMVKSGQSTSMQKHLHRAEHWIVVSGTAEVTCDDDIFMLTENEAAYIPLGSRHRLRNPGKTPLEIIEVQSGSYLGEDDIERFDDQYGRA
ncbi:MAG: mannose-1-phosphate guanylyltransferase/mannose-6-phosphate isomerase [Gammaproteobacteria bacterium]|nr:mannose-1-phosphate guanylyltransferase/mannose-6-phosphate isomerase [Gammaproteobacteria bacterium]NKB65341.1 mannose-1-phosphate guanylyltransferase/mannose-6-phosphate isomerase [Gammaproteobacteria bacterium]